MNKYSIIAIVLATLISCNSKDNKIDSYSNKEVFNKMKYQSEIYQVDNTDFSVVVLNKLTGKVFIAKNAVGWYEATNKSKLETYKTPTYSIKVFKFSDNNPQILLTNLKTSEMYIYILGHTADFYEVNSTINSLERESE